MHITYLELNNVRSYAHARIDFRKGVNFISGSNGAGKTTLLECIGLAVFGSKPSRDINEYFIRQGEKRAKIAVGIRIGHEDFDIVRLLGTASTRSVRDETGTLNLAGDADVNVFLKEKLALPQEESLCALFENVIGVRQGAFTAPFLAQPAQRKDTFNNILRLQTYAQAARESDGLRDAFRDRLQGLALERTALEVQLRDVDELETQRAELSGQSIQLQQEAAQTEQALQEAEQALLMQRQKRERFREAELTLQERQLLVKNARQQAEQCEQKRREAVQGSEKAEDLSGMEREYQKALTQRAKLEHRRTRRDELSGKAQELAQRIAKRAGDIKWQGEHAAQGLARCEQEAQQAEREEKRLITALQAEQDAAVRFAAKDQAVQRQAEALSRQENTGRLLETYWHGASQAQEQLRDCEAQAVALEAGLSREVALAADLRELESAEQNAEQSAREIARWQLRLEHLEHELAQFESGECPYTHETCDRVRELESDAKAEREVLAASLQHMRNELEHAGGIVGRHCHVREALAVMQRDRKQLAEIRAKQAMLHNQVKEQLAVAGHAAGGSFEDIANLRTAIETRLQAAGAENEAVQQARHTLAEDIARNQSALTQIEKELAAAREQAQRCGKERAQHLQTLDEVGKSREKWEKMKQQYEALTDELSQYDGLDEQLRTVRLIIEGNEQAHDAYVEARFAADRLPSLQLEHQQAQAAYLAARQRLEQALREHGRLSAEYDAEEERRVETRCGELRICVAQQRARCEEKTAQLKSVRQKIKSLQDVRQTCIALEKEEEKLKKTEQFSRDCVKILKGAGERMAVHYRERLSREAGNLYRAISSQDTSLVWSDDYDIELLERHGDGMRRRSFRTLSGGEQMSAALALRLALLLQFSGLRVAFFDEPTGSLDVSRRQALADVLPEATKAFEQILIVSHDDTFDAITENVIVLQKNETGSVLA